MNIYFLAVAVKQTFKSERYLVKVACTLLSLMNETAPYDSADNQSVESLIESQDVDADHGNFVSPANKSSPPTFYTMLLFHRAFCEYAFNDSFGFLLRNDPYYGKNTFGQVARLMPERVAVMYQRLQELKGGKWKHVSWKMQKKSEDSEGIPVFTTEEGLFFDDFTTALESVPSEGETKHAATKEFYEKMVDTFLSLFEKSLDKHLLTRWRNDKLIVYLLGGDPVLAKQFARTLVHHKHRLDDGGIAVDEETGETINTEVQQFPRYPNVPHQLGMHHTVSKKCGPVTINVKETMEFLCSKADFEKILSDDRFVKKYWDSIEKLAEAEGTVRLFDRWRGESELLSLSFSHSLFEH